MQALIKKWTFTRKVTLSQQSSHADHDLFSINSLSDILRTLVNSVGRDFN